MFAVAMDEVKNITKGAVKELLYLDDLAQLGHSLEEVESRY